MTIPYGDSLQLFPTENLAYSTVRIEVDLKSGGTSTGTGFFFDMPYNSKLSVAVLVTNKHVINDSRTGRFTLTLEENQGPSSNHSKTHIDSFEEQWIGHPDPNIDLAIMLVGPLLQQAESMGHHFFRTALNAASIASELDLAEMSPAEDILMIGYPNGIWDQTNNLPVFRRGIAATHPAKHYNGRPEFVIDAACFPGSSGSPVLQYSTGPQLKRNGDTHLGGVRWKLLGVLYAGPVQTIDGEIVVADIPTQNVPISRSKIMMNLGYVIRAEKLLDFTGILKQILPPQQS